MTLKTRWSDGGEKEKYHLNENKWKKENRQIKASDSDVKSHFTNESKDVLPFQQIDKTFFSLTFLKSVIVNLMREGYKFQR